MHADTIIAILLQYKSTHQLSPKVPTPTFRVFKLQLAMYWEELGEVSRLNSWYCRVNLVNFAWVCSSVTEWC